MLVYNYHPETHALLGVTEADESPLEPGVFLIPAHATDVPPPVAEDGMLAVFDPAAQVWSLEPIPVPVDDNITNSPATLFGGQSMREIFSGK